MATENSDLPSQEQNKKNAVAIVFFLFAIVFSDALKLLTPTTPLNTPLNHSNFQGGMYFNSILMGHFVIPQHRENNLPLEWTLRFVNL